ncbi:hypothetical protein FRB97_005066 [Tulasnella sp. 331]|nr:hypothetical protein FRB97_005066 [Tulasnella sp. 331]
MPPRLIPGFYYDPEKKRYFPGKPPSAIQSAQAKVPTTSTRIANRIDSFASASTSFALSSIRVSSSYASRTRELRLMRDREYSNTKSSHTIEVVSNRSCRLTSMAISEELQAFVCGDSFGCVRTCRPVDGSFLDVPGVQPTQHYVWNEEMALASEITSVQCVGKRATSFGPRPQVLFGSLNEDIEPSYPSISSVISSLTFQDIWDSHFDGNSLSLAMKSGIGHIESLEMPTVEVRRAGTDAMAITRHESCVYAGLRDGRVFRSDLRTNAQNEHLLPGVNSLPVTKVSLPWDSELFVARMNGDLHLYDLRMMSLRKGPPLTRKFEGHINTHTRRIGISHDVDREYLFAAGEDDQIRSWNMRSGRQLDTPPIHLSDHDDYLLGTHFDSTAVAMPITSSKKGDTLLHVAFADRIKSFQLGRRYWASEGV